MDERPKHLLEHAYAIVHKADPGFRIEGAVNYYGPEVAERMYDISFAFNEPLLTPEQLSSHLGRETASLSTPAAAPTVPTLSSTPILPNQPSWAGTSPQSAIAATSAGPTTAG